MAGLQCGVDGTDYGVGGVMDAFFATPLATAYPFCPEALDHHETLWYRSYFSTD